MEFDDALEAILSVEALWRSRAGNVRLADLGVNEQRIVRSCGNAARPPEHWRDYPGARAARERTVREP